MKKTDKTALTAAIFAAALNAVPMGATAYDPAEDPIQDVYGPPVYFETATSTTTEPFQCVYGPPEVMSSLFADQTTEPYDPTTEPVPQPDYGPIPYYGTTSSTTNTTEPYDPSTIIPQPAYGPPPLMGDLNNDGVVDTFDLVQMRSLYNNYNYTQYSPYEADVNDDGQFSIADLVALSQYLLGQVKGLGWQYTEPTTATSYETTNTTTTTITAPVEDPVTTITTNYATVYGPPSIFS